MKTLACLLMAGLLAFPAGSLWARGGGMGGGGPGAGGHGPGARGSAAHGSAAKSGIGPHITVGPRVKPGKPGKPEKCTNCAPPAKGGGGTSSSAMDAFKKEHPCPATGKDAGPCPGYEIRPVKPLDSGGADDPSNLRWQSTAEAKPPVTVE